MVSALAGVFAVIILAPSAFAETDSVRFEFGENGTWTVPDRVSEIEVEVAGAGGGSVSRGGITATGGQGALVRARVELAAGTTLTVGVGGGGGGFDWDQSGGGGGGGASIVTSDGDLLLIAGGGGGAGLGSSEARSADGGSAGVNTSGRGNNGGLADGTSSSLRALGGKDGKGRCLSSSLIKCGSNFNTSTNTGGGGSGGAAVGGAGSSGKQWDGGAGGAGYGGGARGVQQNIKSGDVVNLHASGGGAGASIAVGTGVNMIEGAATYYSSAGGAGGDPLLGEDGWVVITWVIPPALPADESDEVADAEPIEITLAMPEGLACSAPQAQASGGWVRLPAGDDCTGGSSARSSDAGDEPGLLGWATTSDFPVSIAQRQVDEGWGAYELTDDSGSLEAVFIPGGGWTRISGDTNLFPIWAQ